MAKRGRKKKSDIQTPSDETLTFERFINLLNPVRTTEKDNVFTLEACWVAKAHVFIAQYAIDLYNCVYHRVEIDKTNNIVSIWVTAGSRTDERNADGSHIYDRGEPTYIVRGLLKA
jgi:hypothetical protein